MDTPKFASASMNLAMQDLAPLLTDYTGTLDKISADITSLEKLISESGFAIETWVAYQNNQNYRVGWAKSEQEDKWRILFGFVNKAEQRPLIETPTEIRLDCTGTLSNLMNAIASKLKLGKR